jgi:hypothetical protein
MSLSQRNNGVAQTAAPRTIEELTEKIESLGWGIKVPNFAFNESLTATPIPKLEFPFAFPRKTIPTPSQRGKQKPLKDSSLYIVCREIEEAHPMFAVDYRVVIKHLGDVCESPEVIKEFHSLDIPDFNKNPILLLNHINRFLTHNSLPPLPAEVYPSWVPTVMRNIKENGTKTRKQLVAEFNEAVITTQPRNRTSLRKFVNEFMTNNGFSFRLK